MCVGLISRSLRPAAGAWTGPAPWPERGRRPPACRWRPGMSSLLLIARMWSAAVHAFDYCGAGTGRRPGPASLQADRSAARRALAVQPGPDRLVDAPLRHTHGRRPVGTVARWRATNPRWSLAPPAQRWPPPWRRPCRPLQPTRTRGVPVLRSPPQTTEEVTQTGGAERAVLMHGGVDPARCPTLCGPHRGLGPGAERRRGRAGWRRMATASRNVLDTVGRRPGPQATSRGLAA